MSNINKWQTEKGIVKSPDRPKGDCVYPVVSYSRVSGHKYYPYVAGSKQWREAANHALESEARANFEKSSTTNT